MRKESRQENEVITIYSTLNRADRCTYFFSLSLSPLHVQNYSKCSYTNTQDTYITRTCADVYFLYSYRYYYIVCV
jgi:hypothetical protein